MLDYFKNKRLKRTLIDLTEASKKLEQDKNTVSTSDPLHSIKISKYNLELLKIATYYDELKLQYPNFTLLEREDNWKLEKPSESEGTVFKLSEFNQKYTYSDYNISAHMKYYENTLSHITSMKPSRFLEKALKAKAHNKLTAHASNICNELGIITSYPISCAEIYHSLNIYHTLYPTYTAFHGSMTYHHKCLEEVAKYTKHNIIIGA